MKKEELKELEILLKQVIIEEVEYSDRKEYNDEILIGDNYYDVTAWVTTREEIRFDDHGNDSFEEGGYKEMTLDDVELIEVTKWENEEPTIIF